VNQGLEAHEQLQFVCVMKHEWLTESGFLTPSLKIKRGKVEEEYLPYVDVGTRSAAGWSGLIQS
jgi:long-chain acyl-CoA synthetase